MRLAGSNTDNIVPTMAPIPTPTINNRMAYKMLLAIGFNRFVRGRLVFLPNTCFFTCLVFDFTVLGLTDGILPGFTVLGLKGGILPLAETLPPLGVFVLFATFLPKFSTGTGCLAIAFTLFCF